MFIDGKQIIKLLLYHQIIIWNYYFIPYFKITCYLIHSCSRLIRLIILHHKLVSITNQYSTISEPSKELYDMV